MRSLLRAPRVMRRRASHLPVLPSAGSRRHFNKKSKVSKNLLEDIAASSDPDISLFTSYAMHKEPWIVATDLFLNRAVMDDDVGFRWSVDEKGVQYDGDSEVHHWSEIPAVHFPASSPLPTDRYVTLNFAEKTCQVEERWWHLMMPYAEAKEKYGERLRSESFSPDLVDAMVYKYFPSPHLLHAWVETPPPQLEASLVGAGMTTDDGRWAGVAFTMAHRHPVYSSSRHFAHYDIPSDWFLQFKHFKWPRTIKYDSWSDPTVVTGDVEPNAEDLPDMRENPHEALLWIRQSGIRSVDLPNALTHQTAVRTKDVSYPPLIDPVIVGKALQNKKDSTEAASELATMVRSISDAIGETANERHRQLAEQFTNEFTPEKLSVFEQAQRRSLARRMQRQAAVDVAPWIFTAEGLHEEIGQFVRAFDATLVKDISLQERRRDETTTGGGLNAPPNVDSADYNDVQAHGEEDGGAATLQKTLSRLTEAEHGASFDASAVGAEDAAGTDPDMSFLEVPKKVPIRPIHPTPGSADPQQLLVPPGDAFWSDEANVFNSHVEHEVDDDEEVMDPHSDEADAVSQRFNRAMAASVPPSTSTQLAATASPALRAAIQTAVELEPFDWKGGQTRDSVWRTKMYTEAEYTEVGRELREQREEEERALQKMSAADLKAEFVRAQLLGVPENCRSLVLQHMVHAFDLGDQFASLQSVGFDGTGADTRMTPRRVSVLPGYQEVTQEQWDSLRLLMEQRRASLKAFQMRVLLDSEAETQQSIEEGDVPGDAQPLSVGGVSGVSSGGHHNVEGDRDDNDDALLR